MVLPRVRYSPLSEAEINKVLSLVLDRDTCNGRSGITVYAIRCR
jgi:hypothetical protein